MQKSEINHNIIDHVVNRGVCIGCGVCAAVCPDKCVVMVETDRGTIQAAFDGKCKKKCGLCLLSCPFYEGNATKERIAEEIFGDSENIKFNVDTGYYSMCWAGHSLVGADRGNGASGGMATWFVRDCLNRQLVDCAVVVGPSLNKDKLYDFQLINEPNDLEKTRGSKYYPVSVDSVLRSIWEGEEKNYLITGLPCTVYGIRLAGAQNAKIRRRVKVLLGLTCSGCPTKMMCEFLSRAQGKEPRSGDEISFRKKRGNARTSYDYEFYISRGRYPVFGKSMYGLYGFAWMNHFFKQRSCFLCDDVFAQLADIVFMDAWLPRFTRDIKGNNLIIIRDSSLNESFRKGILNGQCALEMIDVNEVCKSQEALIKWKKAEIGLRYDIERGKGRWVPGQAPRYELEPVHHTGEAVKRNTHSLSVAEWTIANWPRYRKYGRIGVVLLILRCMQAHVHTLAYFKEFSTIVPLLKHAWIVNRVVSYIRRRIRKK